MVECLALSLLVGVARLGPPLAVPRLEHGLQVTPRLNPVLTLAKRLAHPPIMFRAARARNHSSRRSSRYHRRPPSSVDGTRPRRARALIATTEHPTTAAAAGACSHSCSWSGGAGLTGDATRPCSRWNCSASRALRSARTSARSRLGLAGRGVRSPRRTIFGTALACTPSSRAASRCVTHIGMDAG